MHNFDPGKTYRWQRTLSLLNDARSFSILFDIHEMNVHFI